MSLEKKGSMPVTVHVTRDPDRSGNYICNGVADEVQINLAIVYVGALGGGSVALGEGTYILAATVLMNQDDVELVGQGWNTYINGSIVGHAITVTGNKCVIRDLQCGTTPGGGTLFDGINSSGVDLHIENVYVSGSDNHGIDLLATDNVVVGCTVSTVDFEGIRADNARSMIYGNNIDNCGRYGIDANANGDDSIISGNIINTTGNDGIWIEPGATNCIVTENRISGWVNEGIDVDEPSCVVAHNNTTV